MTDLIERLRAFEGSDELGNGDFSLLREAAAAIRAMLAEREELLEALEDLVSLAEAAMREVGEYDIEAELADARAAIAKATGGVNE